MAGIFNRFKKIKKSISGNREKMWYEETFGMPREEHQLITPVNKYNRRILAELEFALSMSADHKEFEEHISNALTCLETCMAKEGVLTATACMEAEKLLLPLKSAAKEYSLILAAHAHIDMNWMWGWQETVAATLATFRTMLSIMDQYPDFCFSQSQASVYQIVEEFDPDLMEQIKRRIKEGRWEITATAWVETDKNMPTTESLLRHIKYTRDYLREHWDIDPVSLEVDFSPDTFGHSENVPEIDSFGNVKYYYKCRGLDGDDVLFRWAAPSGREVLVYREQHWYNAAITPEIAPGLVSISKRSGGLKTGLIIYGVGDHGGGPTRRDVERAIEMSEWEIYPNIKFGTLREYFKIAESVRENLKLIDRELNYFAPGCYTTQSRIKLGNRKSEKALLEAETVSALASVYAGNNYKYRQFEGAWQKVLFTHFHDILTGSCVQESREHAVGLFANAMAVANTQHSNALRVFAENIDTSMIESDENISASQSEGAGVGFGLGSFTGVPNPERGSGLTRIFHVFNPLAYERTQTVEITCWDWVGDFRYVTLKDTAGNPVEFALIDHQLQHYWDHKYLRFLVKLTVPASGYTTIVLREEPREEYLHYFQGSERSHKAYNNYVLENDYIRAEFNCRTGALISLIDKASGSETIAEGKIADLQFIQSECATSSAWEIGHYLKIEALEDVIRIHPLAWGDLRRGFYVEKKIKGSTIRQTVYLDKTAKALTFSFNIDWHEVGGSFIPLLVYNFPIGYKTAENMYEVPGGAIKRSQFNADVPGLRYGASLNCDYSKNSVVISSDCKYGYRSWENNLTATLINTATSPDPYPERGIHNITLYVGVEKGTAKALDSFASDNLNKLQYVPTNAHAGKLPPEKSLFAFECASSVLSSAGMTQGGELLIRYFETAGETDEIVIKTGLDVKSASLVDLMEHELGAASVDKGTIKVVVKPYSIGAVKIKI